MKLYLHIGTEKTGTTSFQVWLKQNTARLREHGIWSAQSLDLPEHRKLSVLGRDTDRPEDGYRLYGVTDEASHAAFRRQTAEDLARDVAEARAAGMHSFIISSEHLHSRLPTQPEVARVRDVISPLFDEIEVICVLRPQVETVVSFASTLSRGGEAITPKFFNRCAPRNPYFNYIDLADRWSACFGPENLTFVPYKRTPSIVGYFLNRWGITDDGLTPEPRFNTALDYRVIALCNRIYGETGRDFLSRPLTLPRRILESFPKGEPLTLGRPMAKKIHSRFIAQNREFAEKWPGIRVGDLGPAFMKMPVEGTLDLMDTVDVSEQAQWLVENLNARATLAEAREALSRSELASFRNDREEALHQARRAVELAGIAAQATVYETEAARVLGQAEARISNLNAPAEFAEEVGDAAADEPTSVKAAGLRSLTGRFRLPGKGG